MPESCKDVFDPVRATRAEWVLEVLRLWFRAVVGGAIAGATFMALLFAVYVIVRAV